MVGVSKAVKMPLRVIPKLAKAPYLLLIPMAVEAPTACEAVPIDKPRAIGLLTCPMAKVLNPSIAPSIPVITTTAAVSEGIPPRACVTSMAMGVVTDLDAIEMITTSDALNNLAINTTLTIPTKQPTNCESTMGSHSFLMASNCK